MDLHSLMRAMAGSGGGQDSQKSLDNLLGGMFTGSLNIPVEIGESDECIVINMELPGIDANSINITAKGGCLIIKGEKKPVEDNKIEILHQERSYGAFQRQINLPSTANLEKPSLNFKNGILSITIPKRPEAQARQLSIDVSE